jgi:hypothetical protein
MSKFTQEDLDKVLEDLHQGPIGQKREFQWDQAIRMQGDTRNRGKKRSPEVLKKQSLLKKGNKSRTNGDRGPEYIDLVSGFIGKSLQCRDKFGYDPKKVSTPHLAKKGRLVTLTEQGTYSTCTYPTPDGIFLMLHSEYLDYVSKYNKEPRPTFEYPFFKEVNSGYIGTAVDMRDRYEGFTHYHIDRVYDKGRTKYANNTLRDYEFITVSEKIKTKRFLYPEDEYNKIMKLS